MLNSMNFWTSGASKEGHCEVEKIYSWCSNGVQVNSKELPWSDANKPELNESCISLNLMKDAKFALDYAECKTERHVICEVKNLQLTLT
jgi:hypothetical protein